MWHWQAFWSEVLLVCEKMEVRTKAIVYISNAGSTADDRLSQNTRMQFVAKLI